MGKWNIYHSDGSKLTDVNDEQVTIHGLEYNDSWMGECYVTVNFTNNAPIKFQIGDYLMYRGERFELNYDPGKDKVSSKDSYGEAFKYDSVKFNAMQDELSRAEFLDVVLYEYKVDADGTKTPLHYTALPKFSFYVETLDDLLDRIQACLNEQIGVGKWKIFSRNKSRSTQRGCTEAEWNEAYGEGTEDNVIDSQSVTVDSKKCWEALAMVNSVWDVNFIVRGRNIYVGTAGVPTANIFKYGLGNGLYEIEQNADSDQSIITRLRAYGSDKNLPSHYYADLGSTPFLNVTGNYHTGSTDNGLSVMLENSLYSGMWTNVKYDNGSNTKHVFVTCKIDDYTFDAELELVLSDSPYCTTRLLVENNKTVSDAVKAKIDAGFKQVLFISGAKVSKFDSNRINYVKNIPNNMAINRLMLPGFPNQSLKEFWDSLSDTEKKYVNPTGKEHIFSEDKYRPYVDSVNISQIGVRPGSQYFDQDDKTNGIVDIYPTIEEMEIGGVRIDEINEGTSITDDGRFNDGQTVPNFEVYLSPSIDFNITDLKDDDFAISMKDGMCGGRTFNVAGTTKVNGRWKLTLERVKDDALELWFPYNDFQIKKGDHFVLTGIELPDSYVRAASLKLLKYAIALLDKNDYTRYVYQPKVDEIFMARQHDSSMEDKTGTIKSLHDTLKAGDIMQFEDYDLGIDGKITIDQLTIKEEEGKIPTYEITLREDKEVGTIQKIQQQISSLESGNGGVGGGGGATTSQVKNIVAAEGSKHFLSKQSDDTAQGLITFVKGLKLGSNGNYYLGADGVGRLQSLILDLLKSSDYDYDTQTGYGFTRRRDGKYQLALTDLLVWGKAIFNNLEVRNLYSVGGNIVLSPSSSKLIKVEDYYTEDASGNKVQTGWKCYLLADDGTMATTNQWQVDDQARCQTFNIAEGVYDNVSNKNYWRRITDVSKANEVITDEQGNVLYDGKKFAWVVISKDDCMEGSDTPQANDTIVCMGNRTSTDRQHIIILETVGDHAPSICLYRGVNSYSLTGKAIFDMSFEGVKVISKYFEQKTVTGDTIYTPNYLGEWKSDSTYGYYDEVDHNGTLWLCIAPEGEKVTDEPSRTSANWKAMTAIMDVVLNIQQSLGEWIDKGETNHITCTVVRGFEDITDQVTSWEITRDSGDEANDAAWGNKPKVKNFAGEIDIAWTDEEDDLGDAVSCMFTITAYSGNKVKLAKNKISI